VKRSEVKTGGLQVPHSACAPQLLLLVVTRQCLEHTFPSPTPENARMATWQHMLHNTCAFRLQFTASFVTWPVIGFRCRTVANGKIDSACILFHTVRNTSYTGTAETVDNAVYFWKVQDSNVSHDVCSHDWGFFEIFLSFFIQKPINYNEIHHSHLRTEWCLLGCYAVWLL
jgi:hypothetical protein